MTLSIQNYIQSSPCARAVLYSAITVEVVYFLSLFRALLMHLSAVLVLNLIATLVNLFSFDPRPYFRGRSICPRMTDYYEMVLSKQPADVQDHLSNHILCTQDTS